MDAGRLSCALASAGGIGGDCAVVPLCTDTDSSTCKASRAGRGTGSTAGGAWYWKTCQATPTPSTKVAAAAIGTKREWRFSVVRRAAASMLASVAGSGDTGGSRR